MAADITPAYIKHVCDWSLADLNELLERGVWFEPWRCTDGGRPVLCVWSPHSDWARVWDGLSERDRTTQQADALNPL